MEARKAVSKLLLIVDDREAALEQFRLIANDLSPEVTAMEDK